MYRAHFQSLFLLLSSVLVASGQDPIRFARTPDIAPDGKHVAFSYLGDIWVVEMIGGVARPVTMHQAHEVNPVFSPDGRSIAFSSNRHGQYDVFVIPVHGGRPRRLTHDSAQDVALGWTPDGKGVYYSSTRSTAFPRASELFVVPVDGGAERKLPFLDAKDAAFSPAGNLVAFVRGPGTWYRRNYRGSSNDDLWLADPQGGAIRQLTTFAGQDSAPMFSPDGKRLYYVTELSGGPANVVCQELSAGTSPAPTGNPRPVTSHKEDSVRKARISGDGDWIVYECGGDLWVVSTRSGQSRKLAIEVHADDKTNTERTVTYTNNATEYALSPDEKTVAFVIHGEVFAVPAKGGKANRLTDMPSVEHGLAWSPDSKKLLFVSDTSGFENLYLLESDDSESADLSRAAKFKVKPLTDTPEAEQAASFTPDGNRVVFIRDGKLWSIKTDGTDSRVLIDHARVVDYDWSPDGKWIVYSRADGSFASELFISPIDGSKPPVNVTRYATFNADVSWGGNVLAFLSQRRSGVGVHVLSLQKPAPAGSPAAAGEIDWEDIHHRVTRVGPPASSACISRDGNKVAFQSSGDLWVASSDGRSVNRVTTGGVSPSLIRWSRGGSVFFLDGSGSIRFVPPTAGFGGAAPPVNTVSFTARMSIRQDEEFQEMFDQSWRLLSESFYDQKLHGTDWMVVREKYRPLVRHVTMKEDLYNLISLMLGELNASHLGISGQTTSPEEVTADLGLIFDETYPGPGLRIAEILKRGPADRRGVNLKAGDVIVSIDRTVLSEQVNLSRLLNAKVNENVLLEVSARPEDPKDRRRVELRAASRGDVEKLMYDRWVETNAGLVARQSGGKVGYIHIPAMNEEGLEVFVRSLYSDNFDKEAIVIDVRYNGGGFTHDQVLNYLGGKEHTFFRQRDGGEGLVMRNYDRKWTKPSAVVINNRSYSDAEIFPAAYRSLGYGKVVGQATGGAVIGTLETRLIDGSRFRLPRTGVFTSSGVNMEKQGVTPDVPVDANPEDFARGGDPQLARAVEVVTQEVAELKRAKAGMAVTASPGTSTSGKTPEVGMPPAPPK